MTPLDLTRRTFLRDGALGLGGLALGSLLADGAEAGVNPLAARKPPLPAKAKAVIVLHLAGSPPHLDLLDYKPELVKRDGQPIPESFVKGKRFAFTSGIPTLLGTPQPFKRRGQSGAWVSDALPGIASIADELCFLKGVWTEQFNHAPAELLLYTGSPRPGRPGFGAWVTYGLGSESQNLPGFIVLVSGGSLPSGGKAVWGSGFLPGVFQGVQCRSGGDPVLYVSNPEGMDRDLRRMSLDAVRDLNEMEGVAHPETRPRIAQYEMAFRMQVAVPEVMDLAREPKSVLDRYGAQPGAASFANNCLLARRLVEQGVRFVQLFDWGWDFHGTNPNEDIKTGLPRRCAPMDRAVTALITDLKSRGLLDSTLVVWTGEFGRTPFREGRTAQSKNLGRDHHPHCYSMFLAGGGVKPGVSFGGSDELGFYAVENKVHVHDLQATLLHLLGFDHERLTYRFQGRDFRLTDVHGRLVREVLA
ncbi:MAG: DUF1501 domain-containing protein [Gemmataceae bacterium]